MALAFVTAMVLAATAGAASARPHAAAQLFVATSGSDGGSCSKAAPCKTLNRAYHVAQPGQTVRVAAGSYPSQRISPDSAKSPGASVRDVVFRPAAGASVSIRGELRIEGSHIQFHDLSFGDWYAGFNSATPMAQQTAHLGFYNIKASAFYDHANYVNIIGGAYGPLRDDASQISDCYQCGYSPQHITIDGVYFHDYVRSSTGVHMECLHVYAASYLTIRRSRFYNCAIMDVFINNYAGSPDIHDIVVENNWFDTPGSHGGSASRGSYALNIAPYYRGRNINKILVRNNTSLGTIRIAIDSVGSVTNTRIVGNLAQMAGYQCIRGGHGVTYEHNVWFSDDSRVAKCGSTDHTASNGRTGAGFTNIGGFDLHLAARSPAIGAGAAGDTPTVDIDNQARPRRFAPDAGADQREPASINLSGAIGAARLGASEQTIRTFYGAPQGRSARALGTRGPRVTVATYRRHGGRLWIAYAGGVSIGAGTTSAFYATAGGTGVGGPLSAAGGRFSCAGLKTRTKSGIVTRFHARGGRIDAVSVIRRKYAGRAKCGK